MIYALIPLLLVFLGIAIFFLYLTLTEYKPLPTEPAERLRNTRDSELGDIKTITTFNLGYCSLDKEQDFFLEGGHNGKTISKERTFDNLISLTSVLEDLKSDFYLLQEVDTHGTRSANVNQVEHISSELNEYNISYAYNYKAKWVPIPISHPMGSAYSGLMTLSKKPYIKNTRYSLEGQEVFPKSLFFLKRCMVVNEIQIKKSKKLYIINIHLSAYDKEGQYRSKQIAHIMRFIEELYDPKENYIIVGGDFNLLLDQKKFSGDMPDWVGTLPQSVYDSKFRVIFDSKINTVRSEDQPYVKGENFEIVIDGFLVSPNITVSNIKTHDYGFEHTDHNPVTLSFKLK